MKRVLYATLIFVFIAGTSFVVADTMPKMPKRDQIICTCGCKELAVKCGCGAAVEALKKFDEKFKGV